MDIHLLDGKEDNIDGWIARAIDGIKKLMSKTFLLIGLVDF